MRGSKLVCMKSPSNTLSFIRRLVQLSSMERLLVRQEESVQSDVRTMAARLDRTDILLLRQFYITRSPYPHDTQSYVLRLLVDKIQRVERQHLWDRWTTGRW